VGREKEPFDLEDMNAPFDVGYDLGATGIVGKRATGLLVLFLDGSCAGVLDLSFVIAVAIHRASKFNTRTCPPTAHRNSLTRMVRVDPPVARWCGGSVCSQNIVT
jgi:hypothetical protein